MRKKIAMRWRRKALGMGADILEEGVILKKPDRLKYKEKKRIPDLRSQPGTEYDAIRTKNGKFMPSVAIRLRHTSFWCKP